MADILWCCHVRGPDDVYAVYAAPDYETALRWADIINALNWHGAPPSSYEDCILKAAPAVWPWSAEAHAENVSKSIRDFTPRNQLPPDDPEYMPTPA